MLKKVLQSIKSLYIRLYQSKSPLIEDIEQFIDNIDVEHTLHDSHNEQLGTMPSEKELLNAINTINKNKLPGLDGKPIEFYCIFWQDI